MTVRPARDHVRFELPPSLGEDVARKRAQKFEMYAGEALKKRCEVVVANSYEALAKDLLSGKVDAAWAPPFVCARIEAMGVRVLVRGVRSGVSTYRAALVSRADSPLTLGTLGGRAAVWADRDSVGGYLLAMALLRGKGIDPMKTFSKQDFAGSYQAALEGVLEEKYDVTSVFAPSGKETRTGVEELMPGREKDFHLIEFTEESPNDGVAVSMSTPAPLVSDLERMLLEMNDKPLGVEILKDTFRAEKFEVAQRMGYRALYRVALASL
jgi:phosphonate transport system substrate-binding protein